jgi:hypothetical protein
MRDKMLENTPTVPSQIEVRCIECDAVAGASAEPWKAYVAGGRDGEPLEVLVYCPACAAREFGDNG